MKNIGYVYCKQYQCGANFFLDERGGQSHLVVRYNNYPAHDPKTGFPPSLPIVDGKAEFAAGIPRDWQPGAIEKFLDTCQRIGGGLYPLWEASARLYGRAELMSFDDMHKRISEVGTKPGAVQPEATD